MKVLEIGRSATASVLRQALTTLERNADRMSADMVKDIGNAALNQDFTGTGPGASLRCIATSKSTGSGCS